VRGRLFDFLLLLFLLVRILVICLLNWIVHDRFDSSPVLKNSPGLEAVDWSPAVSQRLHDVVLVHFCSDNVRVLQLFLTLVHLHLDVSELDRSTHYMHLDF